MTSATDHSSRLQDVSAPVPSDEAAEEAAREEMRGRVGAAWDEIVALCKEKNASDVGLSPSETKGAGTVVWMRINGANRRVLRYDIPVPVLLELPFCDRPSLLEEIHAREAMPEIDAAEVVRDQRFRFNVVYTHDGVSASLRPLANQPPPFQALGIDRRLIDHILAAKNGIVLVAGQTGSGKSTTLCSILNQINAERESKIVTTEDPIEYLLVPNRCQIEAREVGSHTKSFHRAIRSNMRQNPDYILVGELRDDESISAALEAAETGHVVFATVHAGDVASVPNRLLSALKSDDQSRARAKLAYSVIAIVAQKLLARRGNGRICWRETLLCDTTSRAIISSGKDIELKTQLLTGFRTGSCPFFKHWETIRGELADHEIETWEPEVKKGAGL